MKVRCILLAIMAVAIFSSREAALAQAPAPAPPTVTVPSVSPLTVPSLPPGAASPVPTTRALSLKEAIAIALQNQPQVALSSAGVESAQGRTRQATSGLLPSLSISASANRSGPGGGASQAGGAGSSTSYSTDLSADQLLYDFGRTPAIVAQARSQEESARQGLNQVRQEVINQVKQAYYVMLQNQRLVEVQQRNLTDQQAHLDLTKAFLEQGKAPRSNVVRFETAVADAVFTLATAENAAALSRVTLNLAMGVDARTPTRVEETEEALSALPKPEELVAHALSTRHDVGQARADLKSAEEGLRSARVGNWPALVATARYGLTGTDFPPDNEGWGYGAALQWPIFDSGLTAGRTQQAKAAILSARAALRQVEQTVGSDVIQAYLNVQTAEQKITASQAEVANAEEGLRLATGRYQAGVAAYIEVIDAETALVTAQTNRVNALYGLSTARAALARALGEEMVP